MRERAEPGIIPLRRWRGGCRSLLPWARLAQVFPPLRRRNAGGTISLSHCRLEQPEFPRKQLCTGPLVTK